MINLTVEPESGEEVLFGKAVDDLQSNIVIGDSEITGTLHYVTGYTDFSSEPTEQSGNYLALKINTIPNDATTTVEVVGGTKGPVTLDEDKNIVLLIKNKDTQSIKITSTKEEKSVTKTYSLTGLTLNQE